MPGCANWCVIVPDEENGVSGVPSSKSHWYWTPTPPVTLASNVTVEPATAGGGGGGVFRTKGGPAAMLQVKLSLSLLTPSLAVTMTLKVPETVGVPPIAPVDGLIDTPDGKPLALKISVSPLGSVAETCTMIGVPACPDWFPGLTRFGVIAGLGFAATPTLAIFAIDGVPAALRTNSR